MAVDVIRLGLMCCGLWSRIRRASASVLGCVDKICVCSTATCWRKTSNQL